MVIFCCWCRE